MPSSSSWRRPPRPAPRRAVGRRFVHVRLQVAQQFQRHVGGLGIAAGRQRDGDGQRLSHGQQAAIQFCTHVCVHAGLLVLPVRGRGRILRDAPAEQPPGRRGAPRLREIKAARARERIIQGMQAALRPHSQAPASSAAEPFFLPSSWRGWTRMVPAIPRTDRRPLSRRIWRAGVPPGAAAAAREQPVRAAVAVCAHSVLRFGLLLLRLQ